MSSLARSTCVVGGESRFSRTRTRAARELYLPEERVLDDPEDAGDVDVEEEGDDAIEHAAELLVGFVLLTFVLLACMLSVLLSSLLLSFSELMLSFLFLAFSSAIAVTQPPQDDEMQTDTQTRRLA